MPDQRPRNTITTTLAACVLCFFVTATGFAANEPSALRAGATAVDISPKEFPLNMPGSFHANMADSCHDPLRSRASVLDDGTTKLAMVLVDNIGVAPELIVEAKKVLAVTEEEEIKKLPRLAQHYARNTVRAAEREEDTLTVKVQTIRIGDFAICAIPFEVFAEIGLKLKKRSPFSQTMVISAANGRYGYLPTPEQHKLGGYETWLGTNCVQKDASLILTDNLLEMLGELKKAN
jgi:hypothetical protein